MTVPLARLAAAAALLVGLTACQPTPVLVTDDWPGSDRLPVLDTASVRAGVRATLDAQVEAWNAGSVRGFMDGYAQTDTLTFLSGGTVRRGWEEALAGYVRGYPDQEAMGTLAFSDLTIHPVTASRALVWGRWRLQRSGDASGEGPGGLFTLFFARTPDGWRVVHDHTSSD